jgi:hypothetical protein
MPILGLLKVRVSMREKGDQAVILYPKRPILDH